MGYGKSKSSTEQENRSTSLTQSAVGSLKGNSTVIAGGDLTGTVAIFSAGKDINLIGENVKLNAGYSTCDQQLKSKSNNSGVSIGVTYSQAVAAASAYKKSTEDSQFSDSFVGESMSRAEGIAVAP